MNKDPLNQNLRKLTEYKRGGFVFHGSNNPEIKVLEPRQTHDDEVEEGFTVDKAVFATPLIEAAIIFAAMDSSRVPSEVGSGLGWGVNSDEDRGEIFATIPKTWKKYLIGGEGTVYVLPGELFEGEGKHEGWQVKSHESVKPVEKVLVEFEDFEIMGGRIVWT